MLPDNALVSTTSLSNDLYVGIENKLRLNYQYLRPDADTLLLISNNGIIFYDETYTVIPQRAGQLRIELHALYGKKVDTLGFIRFRVNPLPKPQVALDTVTIKEDERIATSLFVNADSLYIIISDDIPESRNWIQIREFSIGYNYGGYFMEEKSLDNSITEGMKHLIGTQGAGRTFSIKLITQSAGTLLLTRPMYKVMFY